ncbi:DUF2817 domain-containing protein [Leptospira semungkisensis]|uniref:DUF2817 domain-containing protein n=1 Tax=Leptospira semungkisensis TaxID=2484985 RepID=A0A4R9FQP1_9LEPT|nr:M14 family metallopeptidase [Leptospira semungkisensis]TGK01018.1 DUF2817 domain-containing protein [Leptospira semungkisensis]
MRYIRFAICLNLLNAVFTINCGNPESDSGLNAKIEPSRLSYFQEDYESSRSAFRNLSTDIQKKYKSVQTTAISVPNKEGEDLTIDSLYIPAQKKKKGLIILMTGIHGTEAPAGTSALRFIASELLPQVSLEDTGFLFVHSLNPYGFKKFRRVSEHNVDLNRNCDANPKELAGHNPVYSQINDFLNPKEPVSSAGAGSKAAFKAQVFGKISRHGMSGFSSSVAQGQYEFPEGIFFGGHSLEINHTLIADLIDKTVKGYGSLFFIDFHTGIGARGKLHLIANKMEENEKQILKTIFPEDEIHFHGDKKEAYSIFGNLTACTTKRLSSTLPVVSLVIEFGTINSQTISGSLESLRRVREENQAFHYGYTSEDLKTDSQKSFRELFYPSSPQWRANILEETERAMMIAIPKFQEFANKR